MAAGMETNIVIRTAFVTCFLVFLNSFLIKVAETPGIIAEDIADAMAIGILTTDTACVEKIP